MSRRRRLLTRPPFQRRTLEVSEPETTATGGRRRLGGRRHGNGLGFTTECGMVARLEPGDGAAHYTAINATPARP
jgi:hypothetical protein